ncbi:hypothetical protein F8M41_023404 [Gigaspora margarita]|uniref:Serine protease n=1 Tax=Gigaspora margarita TaxID=4874 RepID=A0A8H4B0T4_GIGMA|nr:hypothetical protein F8M41_023404 [Gigaspora margarita]
MKLAPGGGTDAGAIKIKERRFCKVCPTIGIRATIRNTDSSQNKTMFIDDDITQSSNGAHLCKSGYRTHVTCGFIRAFSGVGLRDLVATEMYSDHGDSGGPIYAYKQDFRTVSLNGILSINQNLLSMITPIEIIREVLDIVPITIKQ